MNANGNEPRGPKYGTLLDIAKKLAGKDILATPLTSRDIKESCVAKSACGSWCRRRS